MEENMVQSTLGHLVINVHVDQIAFYKELFSFLGWQVLYDEPKMLAVQDKNNVSFWFSEPIKPIDNDYDGTGMNHMGISVPSQAAVDETVAFLKAHKIPALFETPRHRPEFCDSDKNTYYQVMFESPDRILFEVVYTGPKQN
jgi:catechol 2,3-dioxygenase-like lactoylglutathione lyase family enzyme